MLTTPLRIGLYGVSGVGKSTLSNHLSVYKNALGCIDGSQAIDAVTPGGLDEFKHSSDDIKTKLRHKSIDYLQNQFSTEQKHLVISGHYCFLNHGKFDIVWDQKDAEFYDVIFLLECNVATHKQRCENDNSRSRNYSINELECWQTFERNALGKECQSHNIPLYQIDTTLALIEQEKIFIKAISEVVIDKVALEISEQYSSAFLFDCDGTLNHQDVLDFSKSNELSKDTVSGIFKEFTGYCFDAFHSVSRYMDFTVYDKDRDFMISTAKHSLKLNPSMKFVIDSYIKKFIKEGHTVSKVAISCGFPSAWAACFTEKDYLIGGASFNTFGCLVTDKTKERLAKKLDFYGVYIIGFGNGSSDIGMLLNSHRGVYVYSDKPSTRHLEKLKSHRSLEIIQLEE